MVTEITFCDAWRRDVSAVVRDAREFWLGLGALTEEEIAEREHESRAVGYSEGKVVAASTVKLFDYSRR